MPFRSFNWFVRQEARDVVHGGMLGGQGLGRDDNLPIKKNGRAAFGRPSQGRLRDKID
jgi:hypothetical protein